MARLREFMNNGGTILPETKTMDLLCYATTVAPSRIWTPRERPVLLKVTYFGHGTFGEMNRVIDMQNGEY